ncbi:hypothetical protein F2P81_011479 [Scophthalmus maximus]|uniref:Uncharacterized protein n=1 Tax=Scophthalmus maximus TaxID=52904 RepID=A0A6A4SRX5_SCOMX|nr:hypothetical protein F2P81_011479 [Scophthalmus maximus]
MFTKRRGPLSPLAGGDSEAVDEALEAQSEVREPVRDAADALCSPPPPPAAAAAAAPLRRRLLPPPDDVIG